jgi:predicted DNA-binding transcriptional regulator AlpA
LLRRTAKSIRRSVTAVADASSERPNALGAGAVDLIRATGSFRYMLENLLRPVIQPVLPRYSNGLSWAGQIPPTHHDRGKTPKHVTLNSAALRLFYARTAHFGAPYMPPVAAQTSPDYLPESPLTLLFSKDAIARAKGVSSRTIDNWVTRGLLPAPLKFGVSDQSRVRWTERDVAELDRNLAALRRQATA